MGLIQEKVSFPGEYESDLGALGMVKEIADSVGRKTQKLDWFSCRERFARVHTKDTPEFWFMAGDNCINNVVEFFKVAEDILNLPDDQRTDFKLAQNRAKPLMVIQKPFWLQNALTRSLSTIFLRQGRNYKPTTKNFEEALFGHDYSRRTKNAIMRFLYGFTNYGGDPNSSSVAVGWVNFFGNKDDEYVRTHLVNPKMEEQNSIIAHGSLWG